MKSKKENNDYPVYFNGKNYYEKDCSNLFTAFYSDRESLNWNCGVYVADGIWVYPDGSTDKND